MDRLSPRDRPDDRPAGFQRWRNLLFLHWEVPADAIAALLPPGLEVDTYQGRAFVGVVPFTMKDVSPWWSPSVPGISNFHELNVRTYVHRGGKDPAVWFFSLDAASTIAVIAARAGWSLPYFRATMQMRIEEEANRIRYRSKRRFPKPRPADLDCTYTIGDPLGELDPQSLEFFLAERYYLYTTNSDGLVIGQVHHKPYPLHHATVETLSQSVVEAAGLPAPAGAPMALYSPGVDVDVFDLRPVSA
jgi:hypothetical protein